MGNQITLFDICPTLLLQPRWIDCFAQCRHFDSHPGWEPDYFPGTKLRRCRYCNHRYGTSGKQFWEETDQHGTIQMYCKHFERKQQ